ncbi:hydrogenase iron-sulfur subunit [Candidatus Bathyarchaeota archaeon]|jgi:coenzyme F420-reducing hydrogenase delta subunit/ferredoxin|nr:hydrogenase iron-sulfur subunit [Candidatus Bathyarchaeota archaeon]
MSETCAAAININQDFCSKCSICHSICPYEAIKRDPETGKVEIDIQKCQVCGICYSACPVMAIEIVYYDYDSLLNYVKVMQEKCKSDTLVLMCRGNSPSTCEVEEILKEQGLSVKNFIPLRLPCSGRMPTEFVFRVLKCGIKNVVSIQCEDEFCRFKEGTRISTRRMLLGRAVLEQFGLSKDALRVVKYSRKVVYDAEKCVGCDKCVFICPYKAIEAEPFATPKILYEDCMGCGACALVCPHSAIQVKGFEFEDVMRRYADAAKRLKEEGKFPVILVFVCQWSEFQALDNPENLLKKAVVMEIPCFKALDPVHIVNALRGGFDGVMAVVCPTEDCKLEEGKETAERNVAVLRDALKKIGVLERFELFTASPRCVGDFGKKLDEFVKKMASLPRLEQKMAEAKANV